MNYGTIKKYDIANGEGVRVTLFVSGCRHHCEGCFNPETWSFCYGSPFTPAVEDELLDALAPDYIAGLTLLGGEPFEPENQAVLLPFLRRFRTRYPGKSVWSYSGYLFDTELLAPDGRAHCEHTVEMLSLIDVLVDGEFVLALKNISLPFRGSENQRIIDVKASLSSGKVIPYAAYAQKGGSHEPDKA